MCAINKEYTVPDGCAKIVLWKTEIDADGQRLVSKFLNIVVHMTITTSSFLKINKTGSTYFFNGVLFDSDDKLDDVDTSLLVEVTWWYTWQLALFRIIITKLDLNSHTTQFVIVLQVYRFRNSCWYHRIHCETKKFAGYLNGVRYSNICHMRL